MIITGCQRSGTMSISRILGIPHEQHYNYDNDSFHSVNEVSWMAAPFVWKQTGPIIHLIRHPLNVIRSLLGIRFFPDGGGNPKDDHYPYRAFLLRYLPNLQNYTPEKAAVIYWIEWNKRLQGFPRIRIEDITNAPKLNHRNRSKITWEELKKKLSPELQLNLQTMSENYDYE